MRVIYPVTSSEVLISSGTYGFFAHNERTDILETWTKHRLPDGTINVRVEHNAWNRHGLRMLVHALLVTEDEGGHVERFDVQIENSGDKPVSRAMGLYNVFDEDILVGRTVNDQMRELLEVPAPPGTIVSPAGQVFLGGTIRRAAASEVAEPPVLSANVADLLSNKVLMPEIDRYMPQKLGEEYLEIAGRTFLADCYQFIGGGYNADSVFWLSDDGLLLMALLAPGNEHIELITYQSPADD